MKPWQPYLFTFLLSLTGVLAVGSAYGLLESRRETRQRDADLKQAEAEANRKEEIARVEASNAMAQLTSERKQLKDAHDELDWANNVSTEIMDLAKERLPEDWAPSSRKPSEQAKDAVVALVEIHDDQLNEMRNLRQQNGQLESEKRDLSQQLGISASVADSPTFLVVKYPFSNEGEPRENAALYFVWTNEARLASIAQTNNGKLVGLHAGATLESPMDRVRSDLLTYQKWCEDFEPRSASDSVATSPNQAGPASEFQIQMKVTGKSQRFDVLPLEQWPDSPGEHLAELLQLLLDGDDQVEALGTGSETADSEDRGAGARDVRP